MMIIIIMEGMIKHGRGMAVKMMPKRRDKFVI